MSNYDPVSKADVLETYADLYDVFEDNKAICKELDKVYDRLNILPSVQPKPKTGHWILKKTFPTKLYDEYLNEYKCSKCYREIRCTESQLVNYPYCHCGAKMVEPQESEDKKKLSWLSKRCEDCGNKKCKELGELPKGYDCALWQAERRTDD